jgi:hypothetical protein
MQRHGLKALVTVLCVIVFSGTATSATATASTLMDSQAPPAGNISVVQTPSGPTSPCLPAPLVSRSKSVSDASSFRLTITLLAPLCAPIAASAVIYAMPGNGNAWPQQLQEKLSFTLQSAGVTEVTFTKTARPVQFDVVTGATPQQIAPWLQWHGPLLFPFDTSTSQQVGVNGPPPVVPEVPLPLLLPLSTVIVVIGASTVLMMRRSRQLLGSANSPDLNSFR